MVAVQVWHLESWQVHGAMVYCLDVDLIVLVLVPVGLLLHDVELDVGGRHAQGFPERQRFAAEACGGCLVEWLSCYAGE